MKNKEENFILSLIILENFHFSMEWNTIIYTKFKIKKKINVKDQSYQKSKVKRLNYQNQKFRDQSYIIFIVQGLNGENTLNVN